MVQENKETPEMAEENNDDTGAANMEDNQAASDTESESSEKVEEKTDIDESASAEDEESDSEVESERFLRLAAEFDNYKKRTNREFGEVVKTANIRLLRELVEIIDNFERALSHNGAENDGDAYRKGVELIYNQLADLLEKERVTAIDSVGQPFDPVYHEAMMQAESDDYDEGIVCQEIQKGYRIEDKVLRHSRVAVSKGSSKNDEENK
jgi:molecular chaperone GrpE